METIKHADLHHQARYTIMKVLRNDAPGGMKSIDKQAGGTVKGFNGSDINSPLGEFWFARDGTTPHQNDKALLPAGGKYVECTVSDMAPNAKGNRTPRILQCINALNNAMERGAGPLRRVHHNAKSHRNHIFCGVVPQDAMPLTVFQPRSLSDRASPVRRYADVSILETVAEFKEYVKALNEAGYFVPRSWLWGMSIRDTNKLQLPARKMPSGGPPADNAYQTQGQKWAPK